MIDPMALGYRTLEQTVQGKTAIITGGTAGIGKACVEVFCAAGMNVVTLGRSRDKGLRLAEEINAAGRGQCLFFECDVKNTARIREIVRLTAERFGGIDALVNCAGVFPEPKAIDDVSEEQYRDILENNLVSYFSFCKYSLPYIRQAKGSIVNIGSIIACTGGRHCQAYLSSKGAIEALTRGLALDEATNGVRVNEIKPGHINTEIFQQMLDRSDNPDELRRYFDQVQCLGRGGQPEEVAYAVLFMISGWSSFITGTDLIVSGGYELGEGEINLKP